MCSRNAADGRMDVGMMDNGWMDASSNAVLRYFGFVPSPWMVANVCPPHAATAIWSGSDKVLNKPRWIRKNYSSLDDEIQAVMSRCCSWMPLPINGVYF